ncbi:thioredoxin domain-containing protein, partial [Linderina pennispora]
VDFTATWCGPCRMIGPIFHKLAETTEGVAFASVDVDKNKEVAEKYRIRAMPTFVFIRDGEKVDELAGANKGGLENKIQSLAA